MCTNATFEKVEKKLLTTFTKCAIDPKVAGFG